MPENHIVTSFDQDLKRLDKIIAEMGGWLKFNVLLPLRLY